MCSIVKIPYKPGLEQVGVRDAAVHGLDPDGVVEGVEGVGPAGRGAGGDGGAAAGVAWAEGGGPAEAEGRGGAAAEGPRDEGVEGVEGGVAGA